MATSERAFNQVKAILGKLDESIDAARARRTHPAAPPPPASPAHPAPDPAREAPPPAPAPAPPTNRAQPLHPQRAQPLRFDQPGGFRRVGS